MTQHADKDIPWTDDTHIADIVIQYRYEREGSKYFFRALQAGGPLMAGREFDSFHRIVTALHAGGHL